MTKAEYHKPPEHIQLLEIANTPPWLRMRLRKEAMEEVFDAIKEESLTSCCNSEPLEFCLNIDYNVFDKLKESFLSANQKVKE